ncbi:MAG: radical SAM protein [Patescibacteria group bacterium]
MKKLEYYPWSPKILDNALKKYAKGKIPTAYLELTAKCSYCRCLYCDSRSGMANRGELTFPEIKKLILNLKKLGLQWLFICGLGEPREENYFFDILKFLKDQKIKVSFFTNGLAYKDEDVKFLKKYNANIILKLDTFDGKVFDKILCKNGASKKIYDFVDKLIQNNFIKVNSDNETNLAFSIVATKLNLDAIPSVINFCKKHNIFPCVDEMEYTHRAKLNYKELAVKESDLIELKAKIDKILGYSYKRTLCQGIIPSLHINNVGKIVIDRRTGLSCDWFFQEDPAYLEMGDVRSDNLSDVVRKMNEYRMKKLPEIKSLFSNRTSIISAGGGTKPSTWYKRYVNIMNVIKKKK